MKKIVMVFLITLLLAPSFCFAKDGSSNSFELSPLIGSFDLKDPQITLYREEENDLVKLRGYDDELNGSYLFKRSVRASNGSNVDLIVRCNLSYGKMIEVQDIYINCYGKVFEGETKARIVNPTAMVYDIYGNLYNHGEFTHTVDVGANGKIINGSYKLEYKSTYLGYIGESGSFWMSDRVR